MSAIRLYLFLCSLEKKRTYLVKSTFFDIAESNSYYLISKCTMSRGEMHNSRWRLIQSLDVDKKRPRKVGIEVDTALTYFVTCYVSLPT